MTSLNEEETYEHLKVLGKFWVISLIVFVILASIVILF